MLEQIFESYSDDINRMCHNIVQQLPNNTSELVMRLSPSVEVRSKLPDHSRIKVDNLGYEMKNQWLRLFVPENIVHLKKKQVRTYLM